MADRPSLCALDRPCGRDREKRAVVTVAHVTVFGRRRVHDRQRAADHVRAGLGVVAPGPARRRRGQRAVRPRHARACARRPLLGSLGPDGHPVRDRCAVPGGRAVRRRDAMARPSAARHCSMTHARRGHRRSARVTAP
ncbi:hypothetical protein F01_420642 [Burkholderia cenocepacia]|nr:hypothetical protein F01_420642 [Burkholderia cenocepacia]